MRTSKAESHVPLEDISSKSPELRYYLGPFATFDFEELFPETQLGRYNQMFWAAVSVLSLPLLIGLSVGLGSSDFLVALAFIQIISVFGIFPSVIIRSLQFYKMVRIYHLLTAGFVSFCVFFIANRLAVAFAEIGGPVNDVYNWTWTQYLATDDGDENLEGNSIAFGFKYPSTAILFLLLLYVMIPALAFIEEIIFRQGTLHWRSGLVRSVIFGSIHLLAGASIGTSLVLLTFAGIMFTREYFEGIRRAAFARIVQAAREAEETEENRDTRNFILKHDKDVSTVMEILGFHDVSFRSLANWGTPIQFDWSNVLRTTFPLSKDPALNHIQTLSPIDEDKIAGTTAATLLHFIYNIIAITVFFVVILQTL